MAGFEYLGDATGFLADLRQRVKQFGLDLHKTGSPIQFGRFAAERSDWRGLGGPESFDLLGVTYICAKTRKTRF